MKILFFIESLCSGGKERRLVELLFYLKQNTDYNIRLVLTETEIHYTYIRNLDIPIDILKRRGFKKDPSLFFRFYRIVKQFKPDIIHTWGTMSTFYTIPAKLLLKKALLANLISDAKNNRERSSLSNYFLRADIRFADVILGNSKAGFKVYGLQNNLKTHLIYNGVRLNRFKVNTDIEDIRNQLNISTKYVVIMVASASQNKNYDLFLDVAKCITYTNKDISFIGIGDGSELERLKKRVESENIQNTLLLGKRNDVETLIKIADVCVLFTYSEGISNSIIEYMALEKPVITTDMVGGSCEIIKEGESGYIMQSNADALSKKIIELINNSALRKQLGSKGKEIAEQRFSIERMGKEYIELYEKIFIK